MKKIVWSVFNNSLEIQTVLNLFLFFPLSHEHSIYYDHSHSRDILTHITRSYDTEKILHAFLTVYFRIEPIAFCLWHSKTSFILKCLRCDCVFLLLSVCAIILLSFHSFTRSVPYIDTTRLFNEFIKDIAKHRRISDNTKQQSTLYTSI